MRRWIRQGLFRCANSSGGRIERGELLRWARGHGITTAGQRLERPKPAADLLADAIERGAVTCGADPGSAAEAIELAVGAVSGLDLGQRAKLLTEVLERERMASTGLGHGVALPHPRKPPIAFIDKPMISVCFLERSLDWAALDGEPVFAILLLLSPSSSIHLQVLARIAFILRLTEFRDFLRERPSKEEFVRHLRSIRKES